MTVKKDITFTMDDDDYCVYQDMLCMLETMATYAKEEKYTQCAERANKLWNELKEFFSFYCDED